MKDLIKRNLPRSANRDTKPDMKALLDWLEEAAGSTAYGEVGIIFAMHQGNVKLVTKIREIREKRY